MSRANATLAISEHLRACAARAIQPEFDPDLPPDSDKNRAAAAARNLTFDKRSGYYVDSDGCQIRDRFGQRL